MKGWTLALGVGLALCTTGARAADLEEPYYRGQAYEDPRYADMYRYPRPAEPVYRDRDERYEGRYDGRFVQRPSCVPRHVVRDRLARDGWQDFRLEELDGPVAQLRARRPSGRPFILTVDRCSGEIVGARPLAPGAFAGGPPYVRYDRPY